MSKKRTFLKIIVPVFLLIVLAVGAFVLKHLLNRSEAFETKIQAEDVFVPQPTGIRVEAWMEGLEVPWSLIVLERHRGEFTVRKLERRFAEDFDKGRYGRFRDVVNGPDGALYFLTSNRDGRGTPHPGDDKIYRIRFSK